MHCITSLALTAALPVPSAIRLSIPLHTGNKSSIQDNRTRGLEAQRNRAVTARCKPAALTACPLRERKSKGSRENNKVENSNKGDNTTAVPKMNHQ